MTTVYLPAIIFNSLFHFLIPRFTFHGITLTSIDTFLKNDFFGSSMWNGPNSNSYTSNSIFMSTYRGKSHSRGKCIETISSLLKYFKHFRTLMKYQ